MVVGDLAAEDVRCGERGAEGAGQVVGDAEADVEADEIGELERPHRVAVAELHGGVDVGGGGDALLDHAHGLEAEDETEAAGGEAG